MKTRILGFLAITAASSICSAQTPGEPAANGLTPTTATYFINSIGNTNASGLYTNGPTAQLNNDFKKIESIGIDITANGNVVVGWENDGNDLTDFEGVWTLFDASGNLITPQTEQSSLDPAMALLGTITNKWLSYFRADGTAVWPGTSWGPKVHANRFGNGFGMGAISYALSVEIPALAAWDDANLGDTPNVQLLNNDGTPAAGVLPGVSAAYTATSGDIRVGDWEYLANGNIMIVGESRQNADLVNIYGGASAGNHCVFRILTPSGVVVKSETLVSEFPTPSNMSKGAGVTANGFALRFTTPDGVAVRLFDNNGNPTSTNLILATITGHPEAGFGGDGGGAGFHGNGKDAYVSVCSYATTNFWLTVLNADRTVRYSHIVADDLDLSATQDCDAAINSDGQVVVVMSAMYSFENLGQTVLGRRFTAAGVPVKNTFFLGEYDRPAPNPLNALAATSPRVAWRGDLVAASWDSSNDPAGDTGLGFPKTITRRLFSTQSPSIAITRTGSNVTLNWPIVGSAYTLESASSLTGAVWTPVPGVVNNSVTLSSASGNKYFRLRL